MVNPKKEPGFEESHKTHEKEKINKHSLDDRESERMRSTHIKMSQGASNFWSSMARPHGKESKANSKHSKK